MSDAADTNRAGATGVRKRILDAAITTLREAGVRELSQVQVARRAGVRQSHLTYYFPKRHDLLEAMAERVADELASHIDEVLTGSADPVSALSHLADAIAERDHMRMFIGIIIEADGDPKVRAILVRHTRRLQAALAEVVGGEDAPGRARLVLACLWGLGLYEFAIAESDGADPSAAFITWLESTLK